MTTDSSPTSPRLEPRAVEELDDETAELLRRNAIGGRVLNIFGTLAHHPDLLRRWLVFATHVLRKSTLAPRERELVILRIGWLCRSDYEWGQHVLIGREAGLTDDEIRAIADGPEAPMWSELDRLLLRATDELHGNARIGDETWNALSDLLSPQQLLDLVFAVGQYNLVSMALNSFGVERDEGVPGFEQTAGRSPG